MVKKSISLKGVLINFYDNENYDAKKSIIFIHGNSMNAKQFKKQFEDVNLNNHRLIAFDLPGHGASEKSKEPEKEYNLLGYIGILKSLIIKLELENYYLVGHSLGGHISLSASSELDDELKGLVIFGSPPINIPIDMENAYLPNPTMEYAFKGALTKEEAFVFAKGCVVGDVSDALISSILNTDSKAREYMGQSVGLGKIKNEVETISSLSVPIAIVHGRQDALVDSSYIESLIIPTLWGNKIHYIEECGHSPHFEKPTIYNQLIANFVL